MKNIIIENITSVLLKLNYPIDKLNIQKTKNPLHGDYSCNIAMILAKQLKINPADIAKKIINNLEKLYPENFSSIILAMLCVILLIFLSSVIFIPVISFT